MIIQNNFNSRSDKPLEGYHKIGKGENSLDRQMELEKEGFIKKNLDNKVIQDIIRKDTEFEEDSGEQEDKWEFFR